MTLLGIDVSVHNDDLPDAALDRLAAHGCGFLFARASIGRDADDTYPLWMGKAGDRGWVRGAYHFLQKPLDGGTGHEQAEAYLRSTRSAVLPDLYVLDVEAVSVKWMQMVEFVERVRREGVRVGVYTSESKWASLGAGHARSDLFDYEWMAEWDTTRALGTWDTEPHPATTPLVQFGMLKVPVEGVTWLLDGNLWHGTRDALLAV